MSKIPNLNDMLKLYTKKDLWYRIQEKNQIIGNLNQQIHALQEQLKNAILPKFKIGDYLYSTRLFAGKILLAEGYVTSITKINDSSIHYHLETKPNEFGYQEQYGVQEENCFSNMEEAHKRTSKLLAELEGK